MAGTGAQPGANAPKVGGNPRTLIFGIAGVAGVLLTWAWTQRQWHRERDSLTNPRKTPTWQHRIEQQRFPAEGSRYSNSSIGTEPRTQPKQVPLPGNDDERGGDLRSTLTSVALGKGLSPDPSVPENPENIPQPVHPGRFDDKGNTYTKGRGYKDLKKPEGWKKTPADSPSQN